MSNTGQGPYGGPPPNNPGAISMGDHNPQAAPPQYAYGAPPPPPKKSKAPGCILASCGGCLILIVVLIVGGIWEVNNLARTSKGGKILGQVYDQTKKMAQGLEAYQSCLVQMKAIHDAINRYHEKTGNYPASLESLIPDYLPKDTDLHCGCDPNTSPTHVTFEYHKPHSDSSQGDSMLSFRYEQKYTISNVTTTQKIFVSYDNSGKLTQQQTTVGPDGRPIESAPQEIPEPSN